MGRVALSALVPVGYTTSKSMLATHVTFPVFICFAVAYGTVVGVAIIEGVEVYYRLVIAPPGIRFQVAGTMKGTFA